jgi:hypothetical protein
MAQGFDVTYIFTKSPHATAMMQVLELYDEEQYLFLDLDCVPLIGIVEFFRFISDHNEPGLIAPIQCANHKPRPINYGGLFFWYLNRFKMPQRYEYTLLEDLSFDVGGRFWHQFPAEHKVLIPFISSNDSLWSFADGSKFGHCSVYGFDGKPFLYHHFEIRNGGQIEQDYISYLESLQISGNEK